MSSGPSTGGMYARDNNAMPLKGLRVCHFGHYDATYSRNRVLRKALGRLGAQIIPVNDERRFSVRSLSLCLSGLRREYDLLLVGYPGHTDMPLARIVSAVKHVPIAFDAFMSLYESYVVDQGTVRANSVTARRYFVADRVSLALADMVLMDTGAHISYLVDTFGVPKSKFRRIWAGSDDEVMYPRGGATGSNGFVAFFYGNFFPMHGIEYIIEAAKILESWAEPVEFVIVGSGQTYPTAREVVERLGVRSVKFLGRLPYEHLPVVMSQGHVCLGIFGNTQKAQRVIPNKVFDGLAMQRAVVTADTPAIRESLTHAKNVWLCPAGNGEALAEAIVTLKRDENLREDIAKNGHEHFRQHFSIEAISRDLAPVIMELLQRGGR